MRSSVSDPDCIRIQSACQWIRIRIRNPDPGEQKLRNIMFWSAGCALLRSEGFFCSLDVLYGSLEIGELKFFQKTFDFFSSVIFIFIFGHQNPGSRSGSVFSLKCWIRIKWIRIRNTKEKDTVWIPVPQFFNTKNKLFTSILFWALRSRTSAARDKPTFR